MVLECSDIYFVGGFGTVQWVDVKEYDRARPDIIAVNGAENTLKVCLIFFPAFYDLILLKPVINAIRDMTIQ